MIQKINLKIQQVKLKHPKSVQNLKDQSLQLGLAR